MQNANKARKSFAALGLTVGVLAAVLLASGLPTPAASASDKYSGVNLEASPTLTPRPIKLRPWLQFGHARPGGTAHYRQVLFNHLSENTEVSLWGGSLQGWDVGVSPTDTVALP